MHATVSGCGDEVFASDWEAVAAARLLLSYLPDDFRSRAGPAASPCRRSATTSTAWCPTDPNAAYDVRDVIEAFVDGGTFFEIKARWAQEIVVGLARLDGRVVGIVANQPSVRSGAIFVDSADKAARFISLCDAFNIPLVFLQDVPGFMVGVEVERAGHHPARRQDDRRDVLGRGPEVHRRAAQGLRGRVLRDVRARLRAARDPRAADRDDRPDVAERLGQRRLRQQDRGDRGPRRAGRLHRRAHRRAGGRHQPAAHGQRPRRRRGRRAAETCAPN